MHLVLGMLQISLARGWLETSMKIMEVSQLLAQGITHNDNPLLQLPLMNYNVLADCRYKKRSVRSVRQLMEAPEEDRKRMLTESLSEQQYQEVSAAASSHPCVDVPLATLKVIGDTVILPGSIVTFLVKIRHRKMSEAVAEDSDTDEAKKPLSDSEADFLMLKEDDELLGNGKAGFAHTPFLPMVHL